MRKPMFCVYDAKTAVFGTPFVQHNENVALRSFERISTDPASDVSMFPDDYHLYKIGEYDDDAGLVDPISPVQFVCSARHFHKE